MLYYNKSHFLFNFIIPSFFSRRLTSPCSLKCVYSEEAHEQEGEEGLARPMETLR